LKISVLVCLDILGQKLIEDGEFRATINLQGHLRNALKSDSVLFVASQVSNCLGESLLGVECHIYGLLGSTTDSQAVVGPITLQELSGAG